MLFRSKLLWRRLIEAGGGIGAVDFDTAIAAYLLDPVEGGHDLIRLAENRLGLRLGGASIAESGQLDFGGSGNENAAKTAAEALRAVLALVEPLRGDVESQGMTGLFRDVELPLVGVLARMEARGIEVDVKVLGDIKDDLTRRAAELTTALHGLVGHEFNLNSPTQLQKILFEERGLTKGKKTKTEIGRAHV